MKTHKYKRGFTLVEVALALIIGGTVLAAASSTLLIYIKNAQMRTTESRLQAIDEALQEFLNLNGRLPCVARLNAAADTVNYGREIGTANCSAAGVVAGESVQTTGVDGLNIRIGAVPVRTINLPDDFAMDAWGNRFSYAITEKMATPDDPATTGVNEGYDRTEGDISILDTAGNDAITPQGSAHYVIISHGDNGIGAFNINGVQGIACDATTLEGENCNDDDVFRRAQRIDTAALLYDDLIRIRAVSSFGNDIPTGAVIPFNLATCPPGWVPFVGASGRSVIGTGTYTLNEDAGDGRPTWPVNETFTLGDTGGFAQWEIDLSLDLGLDVVNGAATGVEPANLPAAAAPPGTLVIEQDTGTTPAPTQNRPPFVALLYCERV